MKSENRRAMWVLLMALVVGFFVAVYATNQLDDLAVSGATTLSGGATLYGSIVLASNATLTGDMNLDDVLDLDATSDDYYAINAATSGNGGGLYVNNAGTGNLFAFADGGTTQLSMADGGHLVFASTAKPTRRAYLEIDVGGGTADTETFKNSPSINFDADGETFYASFPVPADWDAASDMTIYCAVGNEIAEDDGDDVSITFTVNAYADGEAMGTSGQACALAQNLTGGDQAINIVNLCTATIDYNEGTYPVAVDDVLTIKGVVNLAGAGECTGPLHIVAWWIEYESDQLEQ